MFAVVLYGCDTKLKYEAGMLCHRQSVPDHDCNVELIKECVQLYQCVPVSHSSNSVSPAVAPPNIYIKCIPVIFSVGYILMIQAHSLSGRASCKNSFSLKQVLTSGLYPVPQIIWQTFSSDIQCTVGWKWRSFKKEYFLRRVQNTGIPKTLPAYLKQLERKYFLS